MTIQELGSIGEFISSIVVLITLIYLAVQVRQTRNATIASTMQINRAQFQSIMIANRDSQIAPIIIKADKGEELTEEEEYRLGNHINLQWNLLFSEYVQMQIGYTAEWAPIDWPWRGYSVGMTAGQHTGGKPVAARSIRRRL